MAHRGVDHREVERLPHTLMVTASGFGWGPLSVTTRNVSRQGMFLAVASGNLPRCKVLKIVVSGNTPRSCLKAFVVHAQADGLGVIFLDGEFEPNVQLERSQGRIEVEKNCSLNKPAGSGLPGTVLDSLSPR